MSLNLFLSAMALTCLAAGAVWAQSDDDAESVISALVAEHGQEHASSIARGVRQVAERWWDEDGDGDAFKQFCLEHYVTDPAERRAAADRIELVLEQIDGHLHEVRRELTTPLDLDTGPVTAVDRLFANVDLQAHVDADLFANKIGFYAVLNFPVHTLAQRLEEGEGWSRRRWAESRMMDRFAFRTPSQVAQQITRAFTAASSYIDSYNVHMDRLVSREGKRLFPNTPPLISHWNLRDELKSRYGQDGGLERQQMILQVMNRIVRQEIPAAVIASADHEWCPETNEVWKLEDGKRIPVESPTREDDVRYQRLLDVFHAVRSADPYTPTAPSYIARRFELDRQLPEAEVEALLTSVLGSEQVKHLGRWIEKRLGRPLQPFDIWYAGFKDRGGRDESALDAIVQKRYPTRDAVQEALPGILTGLGFNEKKAAWLSDRIVVDPSRGAGHATGAVRREDKAHLRTRIHADGMNYKGYNIAVHELGHNVEQVFSLNAIDHWWLSGVPNTAFTEALAFLFQARDLELLGLAAEGGNARAYEALETLWDTYEIGGVAVVDMRVWRWMYKNPDATPAQLREATLKIARDVWNEFFAPVFGRNDEEILAIYSHMIAYALYLPDYPMGHIIAFQIAETIEGDDFGNEFERISRQGRLTPDAWMKGAVGAPLSSKALLEKATAALKQVGAR